MSALPGGRVITTYFDGMQDKQLNYELTGKVEVNDRTKIIEALDKIVNALENEPQIKSNNASFDTPIINVTSEPYYSDVTVDGYIYFRVTLQVVLTILK